MMIEHPKTTLPEYRQYPYSRYDVEEFVRMLSTHYPKCFFEEGRQRRPLKLGIATNIIADKDFDANPELIAAGVDWYISHISYQISLSVAGSKRIDLDGCEVGTVTEQEAIAAQQRANEIGKKLNQIDRPFFDRIKTLDKATVQRAIGDLVNADALDALFARRDIIVKAFEKLAEQEGTDRIFTR